ncbi:AbrB/MazE/SpoVT family DNA-binding domain-containing protein [Natranaerobius trueperi]|uniref:AbrB family transcriptional regulator n=1 Tax=Natranaerobius trueperi TaxID=759412 RepID=A0A226BWK7_9FIRM|nr:AbrB/MazE/SpoVT family DNA-binding domain-containing protein [Natranaerobius trueperi]OWZ82684.1 AbrB family transcriptional regulator [Natranaerobius trueperi]
MAKSIVTVDGKGRVTIPKKVRKELDIEEGGAFFLNYDKKGVLQLTKAVEDNPLVALKEYSEKEYKTGGTRNFREYIKEREQG